MWDCMPKWTRAASSTKRRRRETVPFQPKGRTTRSGSTPAAGEAAPVPAGDTRMDPKETRWVVSGADTGGAAATAGRPVAAPLTTHGVSFGSIRVSPDGDAVGGERGG